MYTFGLEKLLLAWLVAERPDERPELRGGETVYRRKKRVRLAGAAFAIPMIALAIYCAKENEFNFNDRAVIILVLVFASLGLLGLAAAGGEVTVDSFAVTKRVLGIPRTFLWSDISDVHWLGDGSAVMIRAGSRTMTVDHTFVARGALFQNLRSLLPQHY